MCQQRYPDSSVEYLVSDLFNIPVKWRKKFDLVYECNTIQILNGPSRIQAGKAITDLVGPGGEFLVSCRNQESGQQLDAFPRALDRDEIDGFKRAGLLETHFVAYDDDRTASSAFFLGLYGSQIVKRSAYAIDKRLTTMSEYQATGYPGNGVLEHIDSIFNQAQAEEGEPDETLYQRVSKLFEQEGLAEPFKGVTTNGEIIPGLYSIGPTGVPTESIRQAATAFLDSLMPIQQRKILFKVDDVKWRKWMNVHFYIRDGLGLEEMNISQREAAFRMMATSLSAKGLKLCRDIMRLNHTLGELNNSNFIDYGEWKYSIAIMGTPSNDKPWGWQIDGHHLIVNFFILGDQVVMTPLFIGSEPVIAEEGKYKGVTVMQAEQDQGLSLIQALPNDQRHQAILHSNKTDDYNLAEAFKDNLVVDHAGIPVDKLMKPQQAQLLKLVKLYVNNLDEGHARAKMEEVKKYVDKTHFAWIGGVDQKAVFYYRIQSPVILIEFDHQLPIGIRHLVNPEIPNRQHVHAVVRTPNGNDYGKDLLRQHYESHPH